MPLLLASLEELEANVRTVGTVSAGAPVPDGLLERLLAAASDRMISACPERTLTCVPPLVDGQDTADPVTYTFPIFGGQRIVQVPDLRVVTAVQVDDGSPMDPTAWRLKRRTGEAAALWLELLSRPYGHELHITGRWGPAGARQGTLGGDLAVAPAIADAALVWASRAYHSRSARFADSVSDPSGAVSGYFRNMPPDVKLVLDGLTVPGV